MKSNNININFKIDRIISYAVLSIYCFLIIFGLISLGQPDWLIAVSETNRKQEVGIIINQAILLSSKNQEYSAIKKYDKALSIIPNFSSAIVNKAISLKRLKKFDEAINLFEKVLENSDIDSSNIYSNLKDIYSSLNDTVRANKYFELSLETASSDIEKFMKIGNYFLSLKQYDSAYSAYSKVLKLRFNPETYYLYQIRLNINKYNINNDVSNYDKNIFDEQLFLLNLNLDKGLAENYNKMGFIHALNGEYESALKFFYNSVNIWSDYQDANLNIQFVNEKMRKMN
jgi:tetratricopeptide (TPR) repeat protein